MTIEDATATGPTPSRAVAVALQLISPPGLGQFFLGRRLRGVLWLLVPCCCVLAYGLSITWLGVIVGYRLMTLLLITGMLLVPLAGIVDILRVPRSELRRVRKLTVVGFWFGGEALIIGVALLSRHFLVEAFQIPSAAMMPTLLPGDHVMTDKPIFWFREPKRGDVITFKYPEKPEVDMVKRVIAMSGDRLQVRGGHPWINGWEVPYCVVGTVKLPDVDGRPSYGEVDVEFLEGEAYLTFLDAGAGTSATQGPFWVPDNQLWVLGDNRNSSHDSRFWFGGKGGGVPRDFVRARVLLRWWWSGNDGRFDWSRLGASLTDPIPPSVDERPAGRTVEVSVAASA